MINFNFIPQSIFFVLGGCQKLLKNIDFPVDLEIPKDILSNSKHKYGVRYVLNLLFSQLFVQESLKLKMLIFIQAANL